MLFGPHGFGMHGVVMSDTESKNGINVLLQNIKHLLYKVNSGLYMDSYSAERHIFYTDLQYIQEDKSTTVNG